MPVLFPTLKIALTIFGAMCLCMAFLLRENEEGEIQSKLEDLWIKIDDLQKHAISRHIAFIRIVTNVIGDFFGRIFGPKTLSFRSFCVSTCFTIGLVLLTLFLFNYLTGSRDKIIFEPIATIVISLAYGLVVILIKDRKWLLVWYTGFCYFIYTNYLMYIYEFISATIRSGNSIPVFLLLMFLIGFGGGSVVFAVLVSIVRKSLVWLSKSDSLIRLILIFFLNSLPFLVVYVGFHSALYSLLLFGAVNSKKFWVLGIEMTILFSLVCLVITSLLFAISAVMLICLSSAILLHKAFWPALERPIYALQRFGIIQRRKTVAGFGVLIILMAWGKWEILFKMIDKLIP